LLKIDKHATGFLRTVLRNAIMLYILMDEKHGSLREATTLEDCMNSVNRIQSANLNKVEEALYLAKDISNEYIYATSIKIR